MGLALDADQILLRLTSPTSQFVDDLWEMALGSGDESCTRGGLSISTVVKQPEVPQYLVTHWEPGHLADPHLFLFPNGFRVIQKRRGLLSLSSCTKKKKKQNLQPPTCRGHNVTCGDVHAMTEEFFGEPDLPEEEGQAHYF